MLARIFILQRLPRKAEIEADIKAAKDRGESTALMEPLLIGETSRHRGTLTELALELTQKTAGFRRSLPESMVTSLADLVRAVVLPSNLDSQGLVF